MLSISTVKLRLREYDMQQRARYSTISDDALDEQVSLIATNRKLRPGAILARLKGQGIEVQ